MLDIVFPHIPGIDPNTVADVTHMVVGHAMVMASVVIFLAVIDGFEHYPLGHIRWNFVLFTIILVGTSFIYFYIAQHKGYNHHRSDYIIYNTIISDIIFLVFMFPFYRKHILWITQTVAGRRIC